MLKNLSRVFGASPQQEQAGATDALPSGDFDLIVPMIKPVSEPHPGEPCAELHLPFEQSPVSQPLAADMIVMYAIDRPGHLEYISNHVAAASGFTTEGLHNKAIKNLPARLGNVQLHDCGGGVYGLSAGGNFEASLLLLGDLWLQLTEYLPGEPLAAVPSRDLLFVIGSERPNADELISRQARIELAEKRYAISQSVLMRREGKWIAR
jgi:hypothetical protein